MSRLYIFDKYDNLLTTLSNESEKTCPFWDAEFEEELNKGEKFEFYIPGDHPDASLIAPDTQVAFKDRDGEFRLFWIRELDEAYEDTIEKKWICEAGFLENSGEPIEDIRAYETTALDALTRILQGRRWQPGIVEELGINSDNFYMTSVTKGIEQILNTWGGELRTRITVEGNKITGRFIDILARRGADTGKRWVAGKDILKHKRTILSYPITALYPRGKALESGDGYGRRLDIADIEWSVANGDPVDKPIGQKWIGDPGALQKYGVPNSDGSLRHVYGWFDDSEEEDPLVLIESGWKDLQNRNRPLESYELSVILLEKLTGYEHEKVRLGDTTFAINRKFKPEIVTEQRVVKFKYLIDDPSDESAEVTLGEVIPIFSDEKRLETVEAKLNNKSGIWDNVEIPITDSDIENIVPEQVTGVTASGLFKNIMINWDFNNALYIANYEVYASQVAGFTPDASNIVFRGKTSGVSYQAEVSEQWYFRVRAVNTHGVAGSFSAEVTATTASIIPDDFDESTIPEFIDIGIIKQATTPTGTMVTGQLWIDTSVTPNTFKRWSGTAWVNLSPTSPGQIGAEAAIYKQATAPTHLAGRLWLDTSVTPNILYRSDGTSWIKGTPSTAGEVGAYTFKQVDDALATKASATYVDTLSDTVTNHETRIAQTEQEIVTKVSSETFNTIEGRVETAESTITQYTDQIALRVTKTEFENLVQQTGNLTDNPAVNGGVIGRWNASSGLSVADDAFSGKTIKVLKQANTGGIQLFGGWIDVDPAKAYEVTFFVRKSAATGRIYLGLNATDTGGTTKAFKRVAMDGTVTDDSNFYFWWPNAGASPTVYEKIQGYIMPAGTDPLKMKNLGVSPPGTRYNAILHADIRKIRPRVLNYDNGTTLIDMFVAMPIIREVDPNTVFGQVDLTSRIATAESTITQQASAIELRVTKTTYDTDINAASTGLKARMTTAEASIKTNADNIELKVAKNGVISSINQSAEAIKIQAAKVEIDGDLTVTNGLVRIKQGIITNSMIAANALIDFAKIANISVTDAMIVNISATKLKSGTVIANDITFTGKLSGATGDFSGTITSKDPTYGRSAVMSAGRLQLKNSSDVVRTNIEDNYMWLAPDGIPTNKGIILSETGIGMYSSLGANYGRLYMDDNGLAHLWGQNGLTLNTASGSISVNKDLVVEQNITSKGVDFILGYGRDDRGASGGSRALVKENGALVINYNGDFTSGVRFDSGLFINGQDRSIGMGAGTNGNKIKWADDHFIGYDRNKAPWWMYLVTNKNEGIEMGNVNSNTGGTYRRVFQFHTAYNTEHSMIKGQSSALKFLSGTNEIQARKEDDSAYAKLVASEFVIGSDRSIKKNIEPYNRSALKDILTTPIFEYHYLDDIEEVDFKRVGMILDQSPVEIADFTGKGVNVYPMAAMAWKAIQELHEEIKFLNERISVLEDSSVA